MPCSPETLGIRSPRDGPTRLRSAEGEHRREGFVDAPQLFGVQVAGLGAEPVDVDGADRLDQHPRPYAMAGERTDPVSHRAPELLRTAAWGRVHIPTVEVGMCTRARPAGSAAGRSRPQVPL